MIRYSKIIFFLIIFLLTLIIPAYDYDLYFHIKSGEILVKNGLIHHDVFSYNTAGREWFPYEWLFQVTVFFLEKNFGALGIKFFLSAITTLLIFTLYKILRKILSLNSLISASISFFFYVSVFDFITPRPHLPAYLLLLMNLFFILLYIIKNKNLLFLTLPVTLIWSNFHGSIILNIYLFASYAVIASIAKQSQAKTLFLFAILNSVLTILPPLGALQYRLLYLFFQKRDILTQFIDEWLPLNLIPADYHYFMPVFIVTSSLFLIINFKEKTLRKNLYWTLPLFPFLIAPFIALRNLFLAYITLSLMGGYLFLKLSFLPKKSLIALLSIPMIFNLTTLYQKIHAEKIYLPEKAAQFIKDNNFQGRMYNGLAVGGYLLYSLHPQQKVFIDGRTDLYLCCEIPDLLDFLAHKDTPDEKYKPLLEQFLGKYQISYALLVTKKNTVNRRIGLVLTDHPKWRLVYWDDEFQILVKDDGKNQEIINKFAALSVTPYHQTPVRKGQEDKAFFEYQKMISVTDSGKSRNALGFIYLQKGELDKAQKELETAISLNPALASPYMNLGEIEVAKGNFLKAADFYQKAINIDPARTFAKNRLEEIKALSN